MVVRGIGRNHLSIVFSKRFSKYTSQITCQTVASITKQFINHLRETLTPKLNENKKFQYETHILA